MYRYVVTINQESWTDTSMNPWAGTHWAQVSPLSRYNYNITKVKTTNHVANLIKIETIDGDVYLRDKSGIPNNIKVTLEAIDWSAGRIKLSMIDTSSTLPKDSIMSIQVEFMFDFVTDNCCQYYDNKELPYIYSDTNSDILQNFFGNTHATDTYKMEGINAPRSEWTQDSQLISRTYTLNKVVEFPNSEVTDIDKSTIIYMPKTIKLTGHGVSVLQNNARVSYWASMDSFMITATITVIRAFPESASVDIEFSFMYEKASVEHTAVLEYTPRPAVPDNWTYGENYTKTYLKYGSGIGNNGLQEIYTPGWKPAFRNKFATLEHDTNNEYETTYYLMTNKADSTSLEVDGLYLYRDSLENLVGEFYPEQFADHTIPKRIIILLQGGGGSGGAAVSNASRCGGGGAGATIAAVLNTELIMQMRLAPYGSSGYMYKQCKLIWEIVIGSGGKGKYKSGNSGNASFVSPRWMPVTGTHLIINEAGTVEASGGDWGNDTSNGGYTYTTQSEWMAALPNAGIGGAWGGNYSDNGNSSLPYLIYATSLINDQYGKNKLFYAAKSGGLSYGGGGGGGASVLANGGDGNADGSIDGSPGSLGSGGGGANVLGISEKKGGDGGDGIAYLYY